MIARVGDALKRWAVAHREWIIIGVALPAGTTASALEGAKSWLRASPKPSGHDKRVRRVQADLRRYAEARGRREVWGRLGLRGVGLNVSRSKEFRRASVSPSPLKTPA